MPVKPNLSLQEAADLVRELYGLETEGDSQRQFVSYDDLNVFFKASKSSTKSISEDGYVLKITNSEDSQQPGVLEAQNNIMKQLTDAGLKVPEPVLNLKGELQSMEDIKTAEEGKKGKCLVRVLKFMPGKILVDAKPWEAKHFFQCGSFIGRQEFENQLSSNVEKMSLFAHYRMFEELLKFPRDEALAKRNYVWSLSAVPAVLDLLWAVEEEDKKALAKEVVAAFEREVLPVVASGRLEEGVVHGDVNEQNILVDVKSGDVSGVIDFGDVSYGPALYDISINIMYMMLHCRPNVEPVSVGGHVLAG